ncbi:uncharacterized protein [Euwallacea fornicatus]|uniref:uncharacterized protein n=1 Tax=Euwallacea fornicatus TaxID=995702 RepID=UPI0033901BE9
MEEDHEELLQYSDDESLSEPEDHCCPVEKPEERYLFPLTFFPHTKLQFFTNLTLLVLSSAILLVVLPLYINNINTQGNVYSLMAVNIPLATLIFSIILLIMKFACNKFKNRTLLSLPTRFWPLLQIASLYVSFSYLYLYALDRNRVLCHLQDPIKGIVLVFALLYYFFFCRNVMGLRRIFSTTTVIVGLFIAVDYGLCDEFVCRGYDRQTISDDSGNETWRTHSIWTGLYILSLILFAAFYTLLDRHVAPEYETMPSNIISPSFLNTISSSVNGTTSNDETDVDAERRILTETCSRKSSVHFALWIHIFVLIIMAITFWIDLIPGVGKGVDGTEAFNYTLQGIKCHFTNQEYTSPLASTCKYVVWYALAFQIAYITFVITSINMLILSQSAVFTIAAMSFSLPVIGIWWSLFYASPAGDLVWSPKLRGEFICSIIGCPVVAVGLGLLCKAHFEDIRKPMRSAFSGPFRS